MLILHLVTGETITKNKKLEEDPVTSDTWMTGFGKEFGRMAQCDGKTETEGTICIC